MTDHQATANDLKGIDMTGTRTRLAIFLPALLGGGAERTMLNLAHGLSDRGYDIDLVLARSAGPYLEQVSKDLRIIDLSRGRRIRKHHTLRSLPAMVRYLRTEQPDGMISSMAPANVTAIIAKRLAGYDGRLVINEQNTMSLQASSSRHRLIKLSPKLAKLFYPSAYQVVGVSEGVVDDLVRTTGIDRNKVEVIYNPVITAELRRKARETLDHPWFKHGEPPVIIAVGTLTEQKDFATLLEAFASVRVHRRARLIILGEGRLREPLEALVHDLGLADSVSLPGFVDNPYAYMSHAAVFVLSSRWEGLPTVLIEAMACGTPVVATDCPSGPREILKGGKLGCLVPVGDRDALAEGIGGALDSQTSTVAPECLEPYDTDVIMDKYIRLLLH